MARIAFCLPGLPSHAAVHGVLARALAGRGHSCHFVGSTGLTEIAKREGVPFSGLGTGEIDLRGAGLVRTILAASRATRDWVSHGPSVLERLAPDLVVADQAEPGASLAAEAVGVPRATFAVALPLDRDESIPPPFVGWPLMEGERGRRRNRGGWRVTDALMAQQARALAAGCRRHRLPLRSHLSDWISPELDLRQLLPSLDFPHDPGPGAQPVGPLREDVHGDLDLPNDGRPIVFASLGTLQGGRAGLFAAISAAAADLGVLLALAHTGGLDERQAAALPGSPYVRALWPQRLLLRRAAACITHAGMNTVLDCAAAGVPMVAIPLAFEQPATAARLDYHGVARVISHRKATRATIRQALSAVLSDPAYRFAVRGAAADIAVAGGTSRAADLVEALVSGQSGRATRSGVGRA